MTHENIIETIKAQYPRDLRKQMVRNVLRGEENSDKEMLKSAYNVMKQIFSYVIAQLNWEIAEHTSKWDDTPLKIMSQIFPKIETTKWFKEQSLKIPNSSKK